MQQLDDIKLLRRYLDRGSEEAFTTLINRHVHMVYSVALRHSDNLDAAQEITQSVFVIFARGLSRELGVKVTDQTGLTGGYNYSLNLPYPFSGDKLRNAVTNQLGLDLVPSGDSQETEFWVVEKEKATH